jgi:hypothetical protein
MAVAFQSSSYFVPAVWCSSVMGRLRNRQYPQSCPVRLFKKRTSQPDGFSWIAQVAQTFDFPSFSLTTLELGSLAKSKNRFGAKACDRIFDPELVD